jgi:predicted acylesterase/phospholipase RssA
MSTENQDTTTLDTTTSDTTTPDTTTSDTTTLDTPTSDTTPNTPTSDTTPNTPTPNFLKHLVLAGGGPIGLIAYGILKESHRLGKWNIQNIQSIYGTSIGALLAVFLALKYDWETMDDYFIKRPWNKVFQYDLYSLFGAFEKKGIFDIQIIKEFFRPLFGGLDLSLDITMREFYEWSGIEIHVYTVDMNEFQYVDLSHKTHPDWTVLNAVYASACLPIFFSPLLHENTCFVDGGIFLNYPLKPCIQSGNCPDDILGIRLEYGFDPRSNCISKTSSLLDYILILIHKILKYMNNRKSVLQIRNEWVIKSSHMTISNMYEMSHSQKMREEWIQRGVDLVTSK